MSLVQKLPAGPLDIVGDIHGEFDALCALLQSLGYDAQGIHVEGRTLVFVGDFCDRGPNSPAVFALVQRLVDAGNAVAVLGNHEINLLRNDAKSGAGWFFDERWERDQKNYAPFARPSDAERSEIIEWLVQLPLVLERGDLRVVHAVWQDAQVDAVRAQPLGAVAQAYGAWQQQAQQAAGAMGWHASIAAEKNAWGGDLEDEQRQPPFMHALAAYGVHQQMANPIKVLTSGVERKGAAPFFSSGKWRFAERVAWWDAYDQPTPVVVGHYWRRLYPVDRAALGKGDPDLFAGIDPHSWHGQRGNVMCVDFSAGGRWQERKAGTPVGQKFKLAALRWPEKTLHWDDGSQTNTVGFGVPAQPSQRAVMDAEELLFLLWQIDPMGSGCNANEDMEDEYWSQARDIAVRLAAGEDPRSAVLAVFDAYFWDDCLLEGARTQSLAHILAALRA